MRSIISAAFLLLLSVQAWCGDIRLENRKIRFIFDDKQGALRSMEGVQPAVMLGKTTLAPIWEITVGGQSFSGNAFSRFSFKNIAPGTLEMRWKGLPAVKNEQIEVTVLISLRKDAAMSDWHLSVEGLNGLNMPEVIFPRIAGLQHSASSSLAVPNWMGELLDNPGASLQKAGSKIESFYPGHLSLQLMALYDKDGPGFYAAADDTAAFRKNFGIKKGGDGNLVYYLINYPAQDAPMRRYSMPYRAVVGAFNGDWITAAEIYRAWGEKQQWCRDSRLKTGRVADWLQSTALWVWNRGESTEVLDPAIDLKERLGLPVNVLWHWWHGCSYDDGFPEYVPPREGREPFMAQVKKAQQHGVRSLVYMNQIQWGDATASWTARGAERYAAKDETGKTQPHVYNIFTGKSLTSMCIVTDFWRDTYTGLGDSVLNTYGVNGIYMDQTCLTRMCFDPAHGHSLGGGNYWVANSGKLTEQIRARVRNGQQITLSGEGVGEAWMPYVDAFLALQVSRERYAGVHGWQAIPLYQVVYHPYSLAYGNYSSLLTPPYDALWPAEHRPANMLTPLDTSFNRQFLLEQARSFVWGMQPMIANYKPFLATERKAEIDYLLRLAKVRNNCLPYLLHGVFRRPPAMKAPEADFRMSRLSIYAGQKENVTAFNKSYPTIYHSAWSSADGGLGIALASVDARPFRANMRFKAAEYGLGASGKIFVVGEKGKREIGRYTRGDVQVNYGLAPGEVCMLEIVSK
ncbi:DUF6259 domain-containing protein [Chitinophaga lutea]